MLIEGDSFLIRMESVELSLSTHTLIMWCLVSFVYTSSNKLRVIALSPLSSYPYVNTKQAYTKTQSHTSLHARTGVSCVAI